MIHAALQNQIEIIGIKRMSIIESNKINVEPVELVEVELVAVEVVVVVVVVAVAVAVAVVVVVVVVVVAVA